MKTKATIKDKPCPYCDTTNFVVFESRSGELLLTCANPACEFEIDEQDEIIEKLLTRFKRNRR